MKPQRILLFTLLGLGITTGALITLLLWSARRDHALSQAAAPARIPPASAAPAQIPNVDPASPATRLIEIGSQASWSPNGQQLVFSGQAGTGLQLFDVQTRTSRSLGLHGKDCAWSPSGVWIASVRTGTYDDTTNLLRRDEVWLVPVKEGTPRRMVRGGFPRWSTNGQTLYVHAHVKEQILAVNMADLDAPPTVLYDKTPGWYYAVSPDEKQVAFGLGGHLEIRDRATRSITGKWPTPGERGLLPAWSPDGELIAFGGFNGSKLGVWVFHVPTGRAVPVKTGLFTMPAWSADGRWLAFDERRGKTNSVWLAGRPHLDQLFSGTGK